MLLKGWMVERGVTLDELSQKLGVSVSYLSNVVNGKKALIKLDLFWKIKKETGLNTDELLEDFIRLHRESLKDED